MRCYLRALFRFSLCSLILSDGVLGWEDEFFFLFLSFLASNLHHGWFYTKYLLTNFAGVLFLMSDVSKIDFSLHILPVSLVRGSVLIVDWVLG